jgi:hypothetical protein
VSDIHAVCEHGGLRRKCDICDQREEIKRLRGLLKEAADRIGCAQCYRKGCCDECSALDTRIWQELTGSGASEAP